VPSRDEGLVHLVRSRIGGRDEKRRGRVAKSAVEKRAEQREFRRVRDLPQDEVPRAEAGTEESVKMTAAQRTTGIQVLMRVAVTPRA
jgi:hypothetical protein